MIRGAIPPAEEWLNQLPILDPNNLRTGTAIFRGIVNGVRELVVRFTEEQGAYSLHMIVSPEAYYHWAYNITTDEFYADSTEGTGWARSIIELAGLTGVDGGDLIVASSLEKEEIDFLIYPV